MVNFGFCTDSDFLFSAHQVPRQSRASQAASSRKRKGSWPAEPRRGPKFPKVNEHVLSQTRVLNQMDLILEWSGDMFGSHSSTSVSQPLSDANTPPPCKRQRVSGETSSWQMLLL